MNDREREKLVETSWQLHSVVEAAYLANPAIKGDAEGL